MGVCVLVAPRRNTRMLTAYDRRQLSRARAHLKHATRQLEWALEDRDPALRCAFAGSDAAEASRLLDQADRRLKRRSKDAVARGSV